MDLPYYHGRLAKRECEALLLKGGVDGNFLIRDSESVPGALCLCVSFKKLVYNYRIFREKNGYYRIETEPSTPKTIFPNLEELISKFKTPGQGMVVHLSNPIMRSGFCPGARRLNLEANVYENTDEEYVDVLP
uniref:SH2 domain containing 1B2 n=1 Tax=Mus spicilegus TaxID=10103 RepID=A0A8C6H345_MUSSI